MSAHDQGMQGDEYEDVKEQDRFLPIANVARIMKRALPDNAKIAKEAKETVQECVSEFISFITSEASDRCQQEKRKTINGEDILWAMQSLGFENYSEVLKKYLEKYRDSIKVEKDTKDDGSVDMRGEGSSSPPATAHSASMSMSAALAAAANLGGSVEHMNVHGADANAANISAYMNQTGGPQNSYYG
ncbi:transcriptional activator hap3 [Coemansia thaxteri]|uniref:Transcriptional activator hap3 n=1 Tax=Coemansia thaxteri TaxID=2663907 RepID=A0A9W8BDR8_9FUNG|nr:transcriptional activator hap3 [Coemansia thaxteri]KAJ2007625.1 transcriptional activator hap3 [Coemansia thaxteri]KAJ2472698.1 transcriptional activator hap3 [Coemansia sp. RSA 2322]KAJ2483148.1 transcriptional activator hap3 [Coemansia sp. RSA 2320]